MNTGKMLKLLEQLFGDQETDIDWWKDHLKVSLVGRNLTIEIADINWQDKEEIEQVLVETDSST